MVDSPPPNWKSNENKDRSFSLTARTTTTMDSVESTSTTTAASTTTTATTSTCSSEWYTETKELLHVALPSGMIQLGLFFTSAATASYIGRSLGTVALGAYALANLVFTLFTFAVLCGLFSASDTLSPQAYGAGRYRQVGIIAIRGIVGSIILVGPLNAIFFGWLDTLLQAIGEPTESAILAARWYRIFIFSLPFYIGFSVCWKFLSSQQVMMPLIVATMLSNGVILPLAMEMMIPLWGFDGSALAVVMFQAFETIFLLLYISCVKPHVAETEPHFCSISYWKEALTMKPFTHYLMLGTGGVLAFSDMIWRETMSLIVGTLGSVPQSVNVIASKVTSTCYGISLGVGIGLAIRIGIVLPRSVRRAKNLVFWTTLGCVIFFGAVSLVMYFQQDRICRMFSNDPAVLAGAESIWFNVVMSYFTMSILAVVTGIAVGLEMQWYLGYALAIVMWIISLPGMYVHTILQQGGLVAAWQWIVPAYLAVDVILCCVFVTSDWEAIRLSIRERHQMDRIMPELVLDADHRRCGPADMIEETPLLPIKKSESHISPYSSGRQASMQIEDC